jgi:CHAP domain-containing protein
MSTAERAIATARRYIGIKESPSGSNRTEFGAWYGSNGQPWCAMFQSYVANEIGLHLPGATTSKGFAYCPYIVAWAKKNGRWYPRGQGRPGDWVLFDWQGDGVSDHVELVVSVGGGRVNSIGGNTGPSNLSNGGQVLEHGHSESSVSGYMRPPYSNGGGSDDGGPQPPPVDGKLLVDGQFGPATISRLQGSLNVTGASPLLVVDGAWGPKSKRALQARLNHTNPPVAIDGQAGPQTVRALQMNVGAVVDGDWGPGTTRALQTALNAREL